ncbi:MAG: hypothetical protein E5V27_07330 [Mesorhizobium sp.]|nr:MAG: hypothetical protein E5V27_07330 [Mesorhizobium sp.]
MAEHVDEFGKYDIAVRIGCAECLSIDKDYSHVADVLGSSRRQIVAGVGVENPEVVPRRVDDAYAFRVSAAQEFYQRRRPAELICKIGLGDFRHAEVLMEHVVEQARRLLAVGRDFGLRQRLGE